MPPVPGFDAVIGNPPYQERSGGHLKTRMIWQDFVLRGIGSLADGGTLAMIHPSTWRGAGPTHPPGIEAARNALKRMDMEWLSMTGVKDCGKVFKGVGIAFDAYVARKSPAPGSATEIEGADGEAFSACIGEMDFIPSFRCADLDAILAKEGEERVDFIRSRSKFESRRSWMSEERTEIHRHPCAHAVSRNASLRERNGGRLRLMWSSAKEPETGSPSRAHFGVPKTMFGISQQSGIPHADLEGEYGMTQFVSGIADDPAVLPLIAKAMDSPRFRRAMESVRFSTEDWNRSVIALLRRDFWKEFVDADGDWIDADGNAIGRDGGPP